MSGTNIQTFLRVRPTKRGHNYYEIDPLDGTVVLRPPRAANSDYVNNQQQDFRFRFSHIFDEQTKQDEVFEKVARSACDDAINGYNATIFAYGQTSSGKTFTITGGSERYVDRGIIPRSLSYIFSQFEQNPEYQYTAHISYLEIYNETGFDLLNADKETTALEDLPRVQMMSNADGDWVLRGLTAHVANSEEEALNLLFLGDTCRMIAETPQNDASSRSHCVFTINITARQEGSDVVRYSKLHLVDLAGSERIKKSGVTGKLQIESRYINLSLFHLELVIVALHEKATKGRSHIPYRNSMIASVLRDSLGGNCKTIMIANVNCEPACIDDTIGTCRFAQRVAQISNTPVVNEEVNPALVIRRLKREIQELKQEVALLSGGDPDRGPITSSEKERARQMVQAFIEAPLGEAPIQATEMIIIRECFELLRQHVLDAQANGGGGGGGLGGRGKGKGSADEPEVDPELVAKLRAHLKQRDVEIGILVKKLERGGGGGGGGGGARGPSRTVACQTNATDALANPTIGWETHGSSGAADASRARETSEAQRVLAASGRVWETQHKGPEAVVLDDAEIERMFNESYEGQKWIDENGALLNAKILEARELAAAVTSSRETINGLKALIEQLRVERAMQGGDAADTEPEEERNKALIEKEKKEYKDNFYRLRDLKKEIEALQRLIEHNLMKKQEAYAEYYKRVYEEKKAAARAAGPPRVDGSSVGGGGGGGGRGYGAGSPNDYSLDYAASQGGGAYTSGGGGSGGLRPASSPSRETFSGSYSGRGGGGGGSGSALESAGASPAYEQRVSPRARGVNGRGVVGGGGSGGTAVGGGTIGDGYGAGVDARPSALAAYRTAWDSSSSLPAGGSSGGGSGGSGSSGGGVQALPLTGNSAADAEILAYQRARDALLAQRR